MGRSSRSLLLAVMAVAILAVTACEPMMSRSGAYVTGQLTPDHGEGYRIIDQGGGFTAVAPSTNRYGDLRVAVVRDDAPASRDEVSCVTWNGPRTSTIQPGVVLRVQMTETRSRAIMVTNNVVYGYRPGFNVHLVDSAATPMFTKVGGASLERAVGTMDALEPLPWRICARVIDTTVEAKAWSLPAHPAEPEWGDPVYCFAARVPPAWSVVGRPGAYIGHLQPGQRSTFSDLVTEQLSTPGQAVE